MNTELNEPPRNLQLAIRIIYLTGCLLWFAIWYLVNGYSLLSQSAIYIFPFIAAPVIIILNMLFWFNLSNDAHYNDYENELKKMQYIETNAAHLATAISGVLLIAGMISGIKSDQSIPTEVIISISGALICAVVGVLPKLWVPSDKATWLFILRHIKTILFTYAISLFLCGLLGLLKWL